MNSLKSIPIAIKVLYIVSQKCIPKKTYPFSLFNSAIKMGVQNCVPYDSRQKGR